MFKIIESDDTITVTVTLLRNHKVTGRGGRASIDVDRAKYTEEAFLGFFVYGEKRKYADGCPTKDDKGKPLSDRRLDAASIAHAETRRDQAYGIEPWTGTVTRLDPVVKEARDLVRAKLRALSIKAPKSLGKATGFPAILESCEEVGVTIDAEALMDAAKRIVELSKEVSF